MKIKIGELREIIYEEVSANCDELGGIPELSEEDLTQVTPPGLEGARERVKKDKDTDDPRALQKTKG